MLAMWRKQFVLNEGMLEMECTDLTTEQVLKNSGHVDRFTDYLVKAEEEAHRVVFDEAHWAMQRKADACTGSGEEELLSKCGVKHNEGNDFSSGLTLTHTLNH